MAKRTIVQKGDEVLLKHCRKVENFDSRLATLIADMKETLRAANGIGLAAPQVGRHAFLRHRGLPAVH